MSDANRELAYGQVAKTTELFLEWRHKVMAFTFTVTAGLLALAAWMYDHDLGRTIAAPLLLGAILALASAVFDTRNQRILYGCYDIADALEQNMGLPASKGPIARIRIPTDASHSMELTSYHRALWWIYRGLCVLLVAAAILVFVSPPSPQHDRGVRAFRSPPHVFVSPSALAAGQPGR